MRQNGFRSPIIMLTGQASDSDQSMGLEAGANDYIVKPFKFAVLLARIRAQLRQYEASEDAVFRVGPYSFRPALEAARRREGVEAPADREGNRDPEAISTAPAARWWRATCSCTRSGATMPASPPTRSRPTSTGCARRSKPTRPTPSILVTEPGGYKLLP